MSAIYRDSSEEGTATLVDVDSPHVTSVDPNFLKQNVKTTTQAERLEREQEQQDNGDPKSQARKKAQAKAKAEKSRLSRNKDSPIVLGNALLIALASAGLGYGAYQKHLDGKLSWELIGIWSGAVGAFGVVDYFASRCV